MSRILVNEGFARHAGRGVLSPLIVVLLMPPRYLFPGLS